MNLRYGYTGAIEAYDSREGQGFDLTSLGLPAAYNNTVDPRIRLFPYITISDYASTYNGAQWKVSDLHAFSSTFDRVAGSHSLKFGMEYRVYRENQ